MSRSILTGAGNPLLRVRSREIDDVADPAVRVALAELRALVDGHERGYGLAAPQIGETIRAFVLKPYPEPFLNPEFLGGERPKEGIEECLSLPGVRRVIERYSRISLRATDSTGRSRVFRMRHMEAVAAQHEIDHLDGILIVDRGRALTYRDR